MIIKRPISHREWNEILTRADAMTKEDNGHLFEISLKTRRVHCGKKPGVKTRCGWWFQTFINRLEYVLLNLDIEMRYAKCCIDCVLNHHCLLQDHDDVEDCDNYKESQLEKNCCACPDCAADRLVKKEKINV